MKDMLRCTQIPIWKWSVSDLVLILNQKKKISVCSIDVTGLITSSVACPTQGESVSSVIKRLLALELVMVKSHSALCESALALYSMHRQSLVSYHSQRKAENELEQWR